MKRLLSIMIGLVGLSFVAVDSDAARRLGGGKNLGIQRSAPAQQKAAPSTPPQQQQQAAPATPPQQPQPSGLQKWLGPLAGLALGAGLAALFFHNGMGGLLAGLLLIGLIAAAVVFAARFLMRGRPGAEPPMEYAGGAQEAQPAPFATQPSYAVLPGGAGANSVAATTATASTLTGNLLPAGFDAAEFARHAKLNFVRLQEAHDRKDLSAMRDFLTPGVYHEIESDIRTAADDGPRHTDVVTLEAEVIDVAEEADSYIVSVRFSGMIREDAGAPEPFSEIWHLEKPVSGRSGWLVAGIQQA